MYEWEYNCAFEGGWACCCLIALGQACIEIFGVDMRLMTALWGL